MEVSSIAEELLFTVIRIETTDSEGKQKVGTGFIFSYELEDKRYLFLVTCKHLINEVKEGTLTFIKSSGQKPLLGESYRLRIENFENGWFKHESENIDVAILPFVPVLNHILNQGVQVFFKSIPDNLIPKDEKLKELDAVEDVLFIGYPIGLWDPKNFIPVVRKGITATPVFLDFKGEKQFLIDASVFPGSSGSPVFIHDKGIYWDKKSGSTVVGHRIFFLGMLSAVFKMPDTGEIILPTERTPVIRISQLVDIGVVFKAETILETIKEFLEKVKNASPSHNSG
ncbi:MAG: hypothetical protein AOA66_1273 [Candidatus Bathyarchaeota archaeon BA2]|nr:MAG: hypothetical protein AOA66_1273 [Candidatus Bathyarchaeota archaeon BA2]